MRALAERVSQDAQTARRVAAGAVEGRYWTSLKADISHLREQHRFDEARELLEECVAAAEREAAVTRRIPDTWPTEELSSMLHRTGRYDQERTFLERYAERCMPSSVPPTIETRLTRSRRSAAG